MESMMKENAVPTYVKPYKEMMIDSDQLEVPRNTYQRRQEPEQITKISLNFDERIANEPKVSYRDGRYFVFDGQHPIAARVHRNGGRPLPILCKVYFGMTEKEEALLFAQQTGFSRDLGAGPELRAKAFGEDQVALKFIEATEEPGAVLDMSQRLCTQHICSIHLPQTQDPAASPHFATMPINISGNGKIPPE